MAVSRIDLNVHQVTKLTTTLSAVDIAASSTYLFFLIYSKKLYELGGQFWIPVTTLVIYEIIKFLYAKKVYNLDGTILNSDVLVSSRQTSKSSKGSTKIGKLSKSLGFLFTLLVCTVFYSFICLILGAPMDQAEETIALATTLTALTVFPLCLFLGHNETMNLLLSEHFEMKTPTDESYLAILKNSCLGVILGAWAGSVVAPLDWDRPWQVYPIPNVVGALLGLFFANFYNLVTSAYRSIKNKSKTS